MLFQKGNIPWHKGKKTGLKPWNYGLTKETDERVKKYSKLLSILWRIWVDITCSPYKII